MKLRLSTLNYKNYDLIVSSPITTLCCLAMWVKKTLFIMICQHVGIDSYLLIKMF